MFVVLVLVRPQAGGVCARNRLHKIIPDGLIPNRVIDYTPRTVTQKNVFRINCVMIPDSMVFGALQEVFCILALDFKVTFVAQNPVKSETFDNFYSPYNPRPLPRVTSLSRQTQK